ncbi:MAG: MarC family protein [Candidatus Omnitrophica bacterium]|nr:MarC family protein [Candidatus Omnitrophota bacterium]
MKQFLLAFIPIFVAVDAIAVMPMFLSLTNGLVLKDIRKIIIQSVWTAISLALVFILLGKGIFNVLGITVGDFMVAGGIILFCIAIIDLISPGKKRRVGYSEDLGVVPIGTPLIVGPAVLTTCLIIVDEYGVFATILSVVVNVLLAGILFYFSRQVSRVIGRSGANALSKIMALLLAAIAVMMIRKGLVFIFSGL